MISSQIELQQQGDIWIGRFSAMACPCEVLIETTDKVIARQSIQAAANEAWRIEQKFSRYRDDNIIHQINTAQGKTVTVDDETARLLEFAALCYELSEGRFDITSGVLRRAWKFDGSDHIPKQEQIEALLPLVGWHKVQWKKPCITLPADMEIDLGGIGKEYAVDQAAQQASHFTSAALLVNFGGDIFANKARANHQAWHIGVDNPERTGQNAAGEIELYQGGLTTSGDARRYLLKNGVRYSHILDPLTGWPVPDAPRSVTVIANTCLEAGMLSTLAMLHGKQAEDFLAMQQVKYWCIR